MLLGAVPSIPPSSPFRRAVPRSVPNDAPRNPDRGLSMTARDRQASGGVTLASRPASTSARSGPTSAASPRELPPWEELYHSLAASSQNELLDLAARQGLLYVHQLPPVDPACWEQNRQLLSHLLTGKIRDLPCVASDDLAYFDEALDEVQREAVARAIGTPDVCVIQG